MLREYRKDNDKVTGIRFADDFDLTRDKVKIVTNLGKSNARLKELEEELKIEKETFDDLVSMRHQIYKLEKLNELKVECNGKLPNKKSLIELFYSQGKEHDEIALLTGSKVDYIYNCLYTHLRRRRCFVT